MLHIEGEPADNKLAVLEEGNQTAIHDKGFANTPS